MERIPVGLLNELRELGDCLVLAGVDQIPTLENFNPEYCYTYWNIILSTNQGNNAIKDVFIFVEDDAEVRVELISDKDVFTDPVILNKLKKYIIENDDFSVKELNVSSLKGKNHQI